MNTKLFLLIGTSMSFIPSLTFAQCVATQDCETLGYTETSCNGGKGIKCPFGNWWACFKSDSEIKNQLCTELGFTYPCTGTHQTGGASQACNGKYNYCTCADGYEWQNNNCQQKAADYANCAIGALFYSDNTCSSNKISGKTILGVVIMEKTISANGWIMTINPIAKNISWSNTPIDIPTLTNCTSESCLTDIQASCTNTTTITNYVGIQHPAALAAKNYKPSGTPSGKSWCLPSGGLLKTALDNQTNFSKINNGITSAGGTKIGAGASYNREYIWSSSEYDTIYAWRFGASLDGLLGTSQDFKHYPPNASDYTIRPVLAF